MTPEQEQAKAALDAIEREINETAQRPVDHPLPWRVSMRGNIIDAAGGLVLRTQGADKRERRKRGWVLANAANAVGVELTEAQAERLTAARLRWEEVRPPEPGFFEVNGQRYPLADRNRVTAREVAAALNEGAAAGMRAAARDGVVTLTFDNGPATVQARTIMPDLVTPFAGFEFGFVAQQVRQ
jgi:hypothetical protein